MRATSCHDKPRCALPEESLLISRPVGPFRLEPIRARTDQGHHQNWADQGHSVGYPTVDDTIDESRLEAHLCNPPSGLIGNSQYHSSTSEEQDMKRILALPLAIHVGVGTSSRHDGPRSVPAGCQLSRRTQANPTPNLQQVRLHAHSPMVFVGSSMGERPGAPCLKMEQNESKAWTVNSATNLGKQVFPTHTHPHTHTLAGIPVGM